MKKQLAVLLIYCVLIAALFVVTFINQIGISIGDELARLLNTSRQNRLWLSLVIYPFLFLLTLLAKVGINEIKHKRLTRFSTIVLLACLPIYFPMLDCRLIEGGNRLIIKHQVHTPATIPVFLTHTPSDPTFMNKAIPCESYDTFWERSTSSWYMVIFWAQIIALAVFIKRMVRWLDTVKL